LRGCALLAVASAASILLVLLFGSLHFFSEVSPLVLLSDTQWRPLLEPGQFGIWPLLWGTLLVSTIAMAVALPLGLLAAIYLSEFARESVRRLLKPLLELLAAIPTVVYGYFALYALTPMLSRCVPGLGPFNALGPGVAMGIMIVPMVSSLSEDALYAVPASLREGAYALGADKLATVFRVVLPAAGSGIAAAVLLAISRALGETMIVATAAGSLPSLEFDPRAPHQTVSAFILTTARGDTPPGTLEFSSIFAVGGVLFAMTFSMNFLSHRLTRRLRQRF
jgi:phosphate transport system permease protein